jgi:hypothetical protein
MMIDVFIGALAAILCALGLVWVVRAFIRAFDASAAKWGRHLGEQFVEDAKVNPNNPIYGAFHLPSRKNDDPRHAK